MKRTGFTLTEILIAIIFLGIAIAALLGTNGTLTQSNAAALELSTGEFLTEQIRELMAQLPAQDPQSSAPTFGKEEASLASYDDVDDFDEVSFSPPIDVDRQPMSIFAAYRQTVTVKNVGPTDLGQPVADNTTDFLKVTVDIYFSGKLVSSTSWIRTRN